MIDAILSSLGISKGATIGGLLGAFVSLRFVDQLNVYTGAITLICGMLFAAHTTPLIMWAVEMSPRTEGAVAFLLGVFGMSMVAAVIKAMPELVAAAKDRISK